MTLFGPVTVPTMASPKIINGGTGLIFDALKSRLGRKFSALFLGMSLIPLSLVAALVLKHTSDHLLEQRQKDLTKEAKILSIVVMERLAFLKQVINKNAQAPDPATTLNRYFSSITFEALDEQTVKARFPVDTLSQPLTLSVSRDAHTTLSQFDAKASGIRHYQINPDYLWSKLTVLSEEYSYCLFSNQSIKLLCTGALNPEQTKLVYWISKDSGTGSNLYSKDGQLIKVRQIFMAGNFAGNNWHVLTSLPLEEVYAPIKFFKALFITTFGLALVLIMMLSSRQISRLLTPLKRLSQGARQVSDGQFQTSVAIHSGDELEEVATAFNDMSSRIARHFSLLTALSELDRLILTGASTENVAGTIWSSLQAVFKHRYLCVASRASTESATLTLQYGSTEQSEPHRIKIQHDEDVAIFPRKTLQQSIFTRSEIEGLNDNIARHLLTEEFDFVLVVPVLVDHCRLGFVSLAATQQMPITNEDRQHLQDFADRMAVSVSNTLKAQQLYQQAHYDFLTGLPNRKLFRDELEKAIQHACKSQQRVAIIFADLDNFKQVNDSLGHHVGDQLLLEVSARLQHYMRPKGLVARQGGDEFILLLAAPFDDSTLDTTLNDLLQLFKDSIELNGHHVYASISLGVALYPEHGEDVEQLLMNSDTALYSAKVKGRSVYMMFQESMNAIALRRLEQESDLWDSIAKQQLEFYYQPLFNVHTSGIGFEALLRWKHPSKGYIPPIEFIELAEETGFILNVGHWMFDNIFNQINHWRFEDGLDINQVAINISPIQLLSTDFVDQLRTKIERHNIPVAMLELEVTESVFLDNLAQAEQRLQELAALGIALSLDDFGTGYSSLSYLQRLPFDRLKIDRSFVQEIREDTAPPALVRTIVNLAKSLDLHITAEGVEHDYQLDVLRALGCDVLQGYYLSRPLPASECAGFIRHFSLALRPAQHE